MESLPPSREPSQPVPEVDEINLDPVAEEGHLDDAGTDLDNEEALGIPPLPGAASRIVSG